MITEILIMTFSLKKLLHFKISLISFVTTVHILTINQTLPGGLYNFQEVIHIHT